MAGGSMQPTRGGRFVIDGMGGRGEQIGHDGRAEEEGRLVMAAGAEERADARKGKGWGRSMLDRSMLLNRRGACSIGAFS